MTLSGTFQITKWDEKPVKEFDDNRKLSIASIEQAYDGDIQGTSDISYTLYYQADGNAKFNGVEVIKGVINDQENTLVLQHTGKFEAGVAASQFIVIDSYPEQGLMDVRGHFSAKMGGQAKYVFD